MIKVTDKELVDIVKLFREQGSVQAFRYVLKIKKCSPYEAKELIDHIKLEENGGN